MSRSQESPSLKRKRQEPNAQPQSPETVLLNLIKSKGDMGIWKGDVKRETNLPEPVVNKALKTLQSKALIKEVVNIKSKGRKHFMAVEFEPSKELTGGAWYVEGKLDKEFIAVLKESCSKIIRKLKVATAEGISDFIKKNKITTIECKTNQIEEILRSMVLDNEVIEVKSTGLGEYHSIPIGTDCYRSATVMGLGQGPKIGAMASIPCGVCPRISQCTPDGIISPKTCVYYKKCPEGLLKVKTLKSEVKSGEVIRHHPSSLSRWFFFCRRLNLALLSLSYSSSSRIRGEVRYNEAYEEELLDYEEEDDEAPDSVNGKPIGDSAKNSGFRDFLLKPELLRAIVDSGFEHPSEGKHYFHIHDFSKKTGLEWMSSVKQSPGWEKLKTAVFVLSALQQIEPVAGQVAALVLCHTRELGYQICHEFERFSTYLPDIKVAVFYGGANIKVHKDLLKNECQGNHILHLAIMLMMVRVLFWLCDLCMCEDVEFVFLCGLSNCAVFYIWCLNSFTPL